MNWLSAFVFVAFQAVCVVPLISQDTIHLKNPSFEDFPRRGIPGSRYIDGWYDCRSKFPYETPPDIHPVPGGKGWGVTTPPFEGNTYLGLVVRYNNTYESVSQKLSTPLKGNRCYTFSITMANDRNYESCTQRSQPKTENFATPTVLKIWGGDKICKNLELLGQSDPVDHSSWERYNFTLQPTMDLDVLILEAYYKNDSIKLYNGHILVDAISPIVETTCD